MYEKRACFMFGFKKIKFAGLAEFSLRKPVLYLLPFTIYKNT